MRQTRLGDTLRRALAGIGRAPRRRVLVAMVTVFVAYQVLIGMVLTAGLGGRPNYLRVHPAWDNARRIVALTPSARDVVTLLAREPIVEYGRRHPVFGAAVWSYEVTWSSTVFFLSFSLLVALYLALDDRMRGWSALGSLGGAGLIGMLGASVSSLTHCGLGSFGVLLALAGVSTATISWFAIAEPVLIPAGYGLMLLAIVARAARVAASTGPSSFLASAEARSAA